MAKSQALVEVLEEIHYPEHHQEVGNFLSLGVLGLPYVGVKFSHYYGVLNPRTLVVV